MENIAELYKKHQSLRKVNEITKIPLSTLWYKLSKQKVINRQTRITALAENNPLLEGTYIGLWAGDGSRYRDGSYVTKIHVHKQDYLLIKFIQTIIKRLFGKEARVYSDGPKGNRASVKIRSKFIYEFPEKFASFSRKKAQTIRLKDRQSQQFIDGFLLGLTLSDGYLKKIFVLATVSKRLAEQVVSLLAIEGYAPRRSVQKRAHLGWSDLYSVRLLTNESAVFKGRLNEALRELGTEETVDSLKRYAKENGPAEI